MEEEQGLVWFKTTRAESTRGNVTAGDILTDPRAQIKTPSGYASNFISNELGATVASPTATYNFTLDAIPIRSESLTITVEDNPGVYAKDQGDGTLLGTGIFGTINYITGAVSVTVNDPAAVNTKKIFASYQQNFELSTDIPQMVNPFASKLIKTRIYALN